MDTSPRLILLHKQKTSGRVRYLCLPQGVVLFDALPALASVRDESDAPTLHIHPAALLRDAETRLGLPPNAIEAEAGFCAWVDTPDGDVPVLLGLFTTIDPPFEAATALDGRFIAITESRPLSEVQRELLRRTYEQVLG